MAQTITQVLERTLAYKRVRFITRRENLPTFRELIAEALERLDDPDSRQFVRNGTNDDRVVTMLNYERRETNSVFAEVLKTFPGQPTFAAERDPHQNLYRFLACLPPTDTSEFVRGVILFYAYGDGVIVIPTSTFKVNELVDYLNWLLHTSGVLSDDELIDLIDEPLNVVEQNLDRLIGAKSVRLSGSFAGLLNFQQPQNDENKSSVALKVQSLLNELRNTVERVKPGVGASMSNEDGSSDLDVTVEIKLPKGRRTAREALDAIAVAGRLFRGLEWSASLQSGFRLGNGTAAVSRSRGILHINKYPDYSDARSKMADAMEDLLTSRLIGTLGVTVDPIDPDGA